MTRIDGLNGSSHPESGFRCKAARGDQLQHELKAPEHRDGDIVTGFPQGAVVGQARPATVARQDEADAIVEGQPPTPFGSLLDLIEGAVDDSEVKSIAVRLAQLTHLLQD